MLSETANGPEVREARASDAKGVYMLACELADAVGDSYPTETTVGKRLSDLLEEPRARVLVAEEEGEILGVASLWIKPDLAHGDTVVEVPMLAVNAKVRRRGLGKRLMSEIRRIAAENGANLIELVATRDNSVAREFYRSLGFVEADIVSLEFVGALRDSRTIKDEK